jgi:ketosteroid isomerase-like protein
MGRIITTRRRDDDQRDQAVIKRLLDCWAVQDVEETLACLSDDVIYQLYICKSACSFGGETIGKDAVRAMLFDLLACFAYLDYEPTLLGVRDGVARIQTRYVLHHLASGTTLEGSKRFVCTLQGGIVSRVYEYHDRAMFEAFMNLAGGRPEHGLPMLRAL